MKRDFRLGNFTGIPRFKRCSKCLILKLIVLFYKRRDSRDGYMNTCKECRKEYYRKFQNDNEHREKRIKYLKEWRQKKKDQGINVSRYYYYKNHEKQLQYAKNSRRRNIDKARERDRKRYHRMRNDPERMAEYNRKQRERLQYRRDNDELYNIRNRIRGAIHRSLKRGGYKRNNTIEDIVQCDFEFLKNHMEKDGINIMEYHVDVDHIIPISLARNKKEVIALNHWSNLRLLCSSQNRAKNKYLPDIEDLHPELPELAILVYNREVDRINKEAESCQQQ